MNYPEVKVNLLSLMFGWLEGHTHDDGCQGLSAPSCLPETKCGTILLQISEKQF